MNIPIEYKNLSAIAKASGKRLNNWVNRSEGKKTIADFKLKYPEIDEPLVTKKGRGGGTWGHPELAAIFAAWCSPEFTAEVVAQNVQLREQNELLKEKIKTFQVNTPAQLAAVQDEAAAVKHLVQKVRWKNEEEIELLVKTYFALSIGAHPKGLTFKQYLPHWLCSMRPRTDLYSRDIVDAMLEKTGQPVPCQGKVLKPLCTSAWIDG